MTTPATQTRKKAPQLLTTMGTKNALYDLYRMAAENVFDALGVDYLTRQQIFLSNPSWDKRRRTEINQIAERLKGKTK